MNCWLSKLVAHEGQQHQDEGVLEPVVAEGFLAALKSENPQLHWDPSVDTDSMADPRHARTNLVLVSQNATCVKVGSVGQYHAIDHRSANMIALNGPRSLTLALLS